MKRALDTDGGICIMTDAEHVEKRSGMYVSSTFAEEKLSLCATIEMMTPVATGKASKKAAADSEDAAGDTADAADAPVESAKKSKLMPVITMEERLATVVPAMVKIFDEPLTNALDSAIKGDNVCRIDVTVSDDTFCVSNDGNGIPCTEHSVAKVPVPQLAFGTYKTSSNYDDSGERSVAGMNGFGVKLTNTFSSEFTVKVKHAATGDTYEQTWRNGMKEMGVARVKLGAKKSKADECEVPGAGGADDADNAAAVKKRSPKGYVSVTAKPVALLGKITVDTKAIMLARTIEIAVAAPKGTRVFYNNMLITCTTVQKLMQLIYPATSFVAVDDASPHWIVGCAHVNAGTRIHGIVNGARAPAGMHISHAQTKVMKPLLETLKTKRETKGVGITAKSWDANCAWFVAARVNQPVFDSQCKERLVGCSFLTVYTPSPGFITKLAGSPIAAAAMSEEVQKEERKLKRETDGKKTAHVSVPKLMDAICAGTAKSKQCTLLITEGDSALTFAAAGRSELGPELWGAFPIKGKLINAREASTKQLLANEETKNLKIILGLKEGEDSVKNLRYGSLMLLTDSDADGAHIRGLVLNWLHHGWPNLAKSGFVKVLPTPLVVARRGKKSLEFMSTAEYEAKAAETLGWDVKYFKGLGAWSSAEAKAICKKTSGVPFVDAEGCDGSLELAFAKARVDDRKAWIVRATAAPLPAETYRRDVPIPRFIDSDLANFAVYSVSRAIPDVRDGLKICQRKVMWVVLKGPHKEIKVAQLAGAVSNQTMYLHGEQSLNDAITNLAMSFPGSNNCPLLDGIGQFGSRMQNGADAASPRYIFCKASAAALKLFSNKDTLRLRSEEGVEVEPYAMAPALPIILLNGGVGIATGFSSDVPTYKPTEVLRNVRRFLAGEEFEEMAPYYPHFTGTVAEAGPKRWRVEGVFAMSGDVVTVSEAPVGKAFTKMADGYKSAESPVTLLEDRSSEARPSFKLKFKSAETLAEAQKKGVAETLGLVKYVSTANMNLFDAAGRLRKFASTSEILADWCAWRLGVYVERKASLLAASAAERDKMEDRHRYVSAVVERRIDLAGVDEAALVARLRADGYRTVDGSYDFLLNMPNRAFTTDRCAKSLADLQKHRAAHDKLAATAPRDMWREDLDAVEPLLIA